MVAATALLLLFLIIAAVAVEVGMWLHAKRDAQNDVDAMVLAGAQDVEACGGSNAEALAIAREWADRNNVDGGEIESLYVDSVLNPSDAVYAKLSRDVDTMFGQLIGLDQVTVSTEAEALCSYARMAQGLKPWAVQEEPDEPQTDDPCFGPGAGSHWDGTFHQEPYWGEECVLTFGGGQSGKGNFGPVRIEVARDPPACTDPSPNAGAAGYRDAIICGSLTTYCVYEETPLCENFFIRSEGGVMGQPTRDAMSELLHGEGWCDQQYGDGDGRDEFEEVFDTSVDPPEAFCMSPRVAPIFVVRDFQDADIPPKTYYIHHFAALYLEGCLLDDEERTLDPFCNDPSSFNVPGKTQVRVRFGLLMDSSSFVGGSSTGFINVVNLIK